MDKDKATQILRDRLSATVSSAVETDRADSGLTTLSYQSTVHPSRHVWIDTDLDGAMVIDLEDWRYTETWDNSVAHVSAPNHEVVLRCVEAWLSGCNIEEIFKLDLWRVPMK